MTKKTLGHAMAAYFGGRAEVRVRRVPLKVGAVDFTAMYGSVFINQNLQAIVASTKVYENGVTGDTRRFLADLTLEQLYDPATWKRMNRIVLVEPRGEVLPVRMRMRKGDPLTITVTPFTSKHPRWYTLADLAAAKLLGGTVPRILKAIEFVGNGENPNLQAIDFLGTTLDPAKQIMVTVIEERQKARKARDDQGARRREMALKVLAASGAYGIFAEVNITPDPAGSSRIASKRVAKPSEGVWYSDIGPKAGEVHDERPGRYFSPIVAALVTGGARLMLAMAETEVVRQGGTFVLCDTDSLIVPLEGSPPGIPSLREEDLAEIASGFNQLNPYHREVVPALLKREYADVPNLCCYAVSAKRYVLYTLDSRKRLRIVKASESGLGAALGRTANETVPKLARRIWTSILVRELGLTYRGTRKRRMAKLIAFEVPMRRKLPIAQPSVLDTKGFRAYNRAKSYDFRIKPFGFLQAVTPALVTDRKAVRPVAPFERDEIKSRKLPWTDLSTGKPVDLDWDGNGRAGTMPVMRMDEFIERYSRHPEAKAAGPDGQPSGYDTRGVLGRLHLSDGVPIRIGKEIDRLDEEDEYVLDPLEPVEFDVDDDNLEWALSVLEGEHATDLAPLLGVHPKSLRNIRNGTAKPREGVRREIIRLARSRTSKPGAHA
jgi:hypothetical protein